MANEDQLSILKQGVAVWNGWRAKNIYVYADFNGADLHGIDLMGADLRIAHLRRANLFRANLSKGNLSGADLSDSNLREANLSEADLTKANLNGASLSGAFGRGANLTQANLLAANLRNANFSGANISDANLMVADLEGADLSEANLSRTNLTNADLSGIRLHRADLSGARLTRTNLSRSNLVEARLIETDLTGTNFSQARIGSTVIMYADLSKVIGLELVDHRGPSHISTDTLVLSAGKIAEIFLRGCGLSDWEMEAAKLYNPDLNKDETNKILNRIHDLRAAQALQVSPLFLSYSQEDSKFIDKISNSLNKKGVRYWHEMHEIKSGHTERQIDRAIRQIPSVLLILSEHSAKSDWVEYEFRMAQELEKEARRSVLCALVLDNSWKFSPWSKRLVEQIDHNIFDFSAWKNDGQFEEMFRKLMDGLELFYKT